MMMTVNDGHHHYFLAGGMGNALFHLCHAYKMGGSFGFSPYLRS